MFSFHFYRLNQFKVIPWPVHSIYTRNLPKFSATSAASNAGSKQLAHNRALRAEYYIVGIPHNTTI